MSATNKTRFDVQKIIRAAILKAFNDLSLSGWSCIEFANTAMQNANKVVMMNLTRIMRVGWQSGKDLMDNGVFKHQERWMECQYWQFHIILKRDSSTTDSSILAEDVANNLIGWFNGWGLEYLRNKGLSINWIDNSSVLVYNDNSDLYQKRVVIPIEFNVPKMLVANQIEAELGEAETYPI